MKKWLLGFAFLCLILVGTVSAQYPDRPDGLTFKALFMDYYSPFKDESVFGLQNLDEGVEIGYIRNMNKFFNIGIPFKLGVANLPNPDSKTGEFDRRRFVGSLDALLQFHLFRADNAISPYIFSGMGGVLEQGNTLNMQIPVGGGLNIKITPEIYIQAQTERRYSFSDNRDNWHHSIGFLFLPGKTTPPPPPDADGDGLTDSEDECPLLAGPVEFMGCPDTDGDGLPDKNDECPEKAGAIELDGCPDSDGDGIRDSEDQCPEEPGKKANNGCPDRDGDGVIDSEDECPDQAGKASFNGCPDRDGDNIIDKNDDCPDEAGVAALNGCPDNDGDGIANARDKCPDSAGPASNDGCPEIKKEEKEKLEFAMQAVQFQSGSSILKTSSNTILDEIASLMKKYTDYSLSIAGHTDSQGSSTFNQSLSEKRAKSCFDYLVSKGISPSRMSYTGYGESKPIADNKFNSGREKNRRVEFDMFIK